MEDENIKVLEESENGHDTSEVPKGEIEAEVREKLENDKLVTIEKADGQTEILTKEDTTKPDFSRKFENIKSATATNKVKGG